MNVASLAFVGLANVKTCLDPTNVFVMMATVGTLSVDVMVRYIFTIYSFILLIRFLLLKGNAKNVQFSFFHGQVFPQFHLLHQWVFTSSTIFSRSLSLSLPHEGTILHKTDSSQLTRFSAILG